MQPAKKQVTSSRIRLYTVPKNRDMEPAENVDPNITKVQPEKKRKYGMVDNGVTLRKETQTPGSQETMDTAKVSNVALATNTVTGTRRKDTTCQPNPSGTPKVTSRVVLATNTRTIKSGTTAATPQAKARPTKTRQSVSELTTTRTVSNRSSISTRPSARSNRVSSGTVPQVQIEDFEKALGSLQKDLTSLESLLTNLQQTFNVDSPGTLSSHPSFSETSASISIQVSALEGKLQNLLKDKEVIQRRHTLELEMIENRIFLLHSQNDSVVIAYNSARNENAQLKTKIVQLENDNQRAKIDFDTTKEKLEQEMVQITAQFEREFEDTAKQLQEQLNVVISEVELTQKIIDQNENVIEYLENDLGSHKNRIAFLEEKIRQDETLRKQLHESIQELKGNIRVICRVRPRLGAETTEDVSYSFPNSNLNQEMQIEVSGMKDITGRRIESKQTHPWKFDRVFGPNSAQKEVFEEISHLVQSSLDGYNCCIFAYGQTGSGKTYTMEGSEDLDNEETRGMIYRSVQQVFDSSDRLKLQGWNYEMKASFFEIYLDNIRDLLVTNTRETKTLEPKLDANGRTYIPELKSVKVNSPSRLFDLLKRASANRVTAETDMNSRSSRSHSIFQLHIEGRNSITKESVQGLLNFIDLAGSEKLASSGVKAIQAKETIFINSSLSSLKDVFTALATSAKFVPFRNSKLTYLLQNSLSGNSKTMMFVNISPAAENLQESINSLRFASNVNMCNIGTAKKVTKVSFT